MSIVEMFAKTIESQALNHRMPFGEWIDTRNSLNSQKKKKKKKKRKETMFFGSFVYNDVQRFGGAERTISAEYVRKGLNRSNSLHTTFGVQWATS